MNRLERTLYLLPIALLAVACGRAEGGPRGNEEQVTIQRSWPAGNIRELQIFEVDGNVTIEAAGGTTETITLVATAIGDLERKQGAENEGLFETTVDGSTLRIGRKRHRAPGLHIPFLFERNRMRVQYALQIPSSLEVDVNTVNGRISARGLDGDTDATTVNGTIDIETTGTHALRANTVNGRVRAKFLNAFHGARFKSVNGGVQAELPSNASFHVDLSQVNGDFEASFPLNIRSNPGSRRVSGEVNGGRYELKVVTVNGDVELAHLEKK
jgi:hypothetical protein